jgi:hypothetical protein
MKAFLTTILIGLMALLSSVNAAARGKRGVPSEGKHGIHHGAKEKRDAYSSEDVEARDTREDYYGSEDGSDDNGKGKRDPYNDDPQQDNVTSHPQKPPNTTLKPALQPKGEPRTTSKAPCPQSIFQNSMFPFPSPVRRSLSSYTRF